VCRLVEAGVGLGIIPETTARRAQTSSQIRIVALSDPWAERDLTICLRGYTGLSPSTKMLVDHLRARPA
jgi:DNA-binding transcriptional LysR family regulator